MAAAILAVTTLGPGKLCPRSPPQSVILSEAKDLSIATPVPYTQGSAQLRLRDPSARCASLRMTDWLLRHNSIMGASDKVTVKRTSLR